MKYQITTEQKHEIELARKKNKNKQTENRLKVLYLRSEGASYKEIIKATGYSKANIAKIIKLYFEKGLKEITENKYGGNHRNLSYEEEEKILQYFVKKAEQGQIVETKEIKERYEQAIGHAIGRGHIYYILERHGWRKIMPRSKHPKKADEEAVDASKKLINL